MNNILQTLQDLESGYTSPDEKWDVLIKAIKDLALQCNDIEYNLTTLKGNNMHCLNELNRIINQFKYSLYEHEQSI